MSSPRATDERRGAEARGARYPGRWRVFLTMGGRFSNAALAFIIGAVITRALHPDGRAIYALTATVAGGAFSLAGLGLDTPIFWAFSELKAGPRRVLQAIRLPSMVAVGGGLVAYVAGALIFLRDMPLSATLTGALLVPALVLTTTLSAVCYTAGDVRSPTIGLVASGVAQLVLVVVLQVTTGLTPWMVLAVSAASQLVAAWPMARALARRPPEPDAPPIPARLLLKVGVEVQPSRFAVWLTRRADVLIVSAMVTTTQLGLYTLGVTLAEAMLLSTESIAVAALGSQTVGDRSATSRRSAQIASFCAVIGVAELVVLVVIGQPLITLTFGAAFTDSYPLAVALGVGAVATAYGRPLAAVFVRHDRRRLYSAIVAVGAVLNIAACFALIPPFGTIGAAIGSSIATIVMTIGLGLLAHRTFGTPRWVRPRLR